MPKCHECFFFSDLGRCFRKRTEVGYFTESCNEFQPIKTMTEEEKKAREEEAIARRSKKVCPECHRELPLTEFSRARGGSYTRLCKDCIGKHRNPKKEKKKETPAPAETAPKAAEMAFNEKDTDMLLLELRQIIEVLGHRDIVVEGTVTRKNIERL